MNIRAISPLIVGTLPMSGCGGSDEPVGAATDDHETVSQAQQPNRRSRAAYEKQQGAAQHWPNSERENGEGRP